MPHYLSPAELDQTAPDHVLVGLRLRVWYGSPQWQIEALRRLEIPEDMRKQHKFTALGAADGRSRPPSSVATRPSSTTSARGRRSARSPTDRIAAIRAEYVAAGGERSNARYGYVSTHRSA